MHSEWRCIDANLGNTRFGSHQQRLVQFGQLVEALFLAKSISISINCGGSTPCCMDADVTAKIVMYHFACFTAQVVTFTYADGQRPTVNPYRLPATSILLH